MCEQFDMPTEMRVDMPDCGVEEPRIESHSVQLCLSRQPL